MSVKIAIVTGASSGLGREFVRQLSMRQNGLDEIWVIARREERLRELCRLKGRNGERRPAVRPLPFDLTKPSSLEAIRALLQKEAPDVRILVNAAGFGKIGSWRDISLEDCRSMIDLNCKAAVEMTQLVLPRMHKGGRVLEICSTASFQPLPYFNVYSASKAFLYRYSRALHAELSGSGICVTAVCPYWIKDTGFIKTARETKDSTYIRHFPLASREKQVVTRALFDAQAGLAVSTPGPVCTLHRFAAKWIPNSVMMRIWGLIRRI